MGNIILGNQLKFVNPSFGVEKKPGTENEFQKRSIKQITHDGDTIQVSSAGNFSVRFLGIDTPEVSFQIGGTGGFHKTSSDKWINYLENVRDLWEGMKAELGSGLYTHISNILDKNNVAINHSIHAKRAEDKLENIIQEDMDLFGLNQDTMKFFLPFSYEILDGYGRLLGFVFTHREKGEERTASYNSRMLESGFTLPYFIWPNINPFRKEPSVVAAVFSSPEEFRAKIDGDFSFNQSRQKVKDARKDQIGVFEPKFDFEGQEVESSLLEGFELRFLGRQSAPSRSFINLNGDDNQIIQPTEYYKYLPEDRLFISAQYIPLFEKKGWVLS